MESDDAALKLEELIEMLRLLDEKEQRKIYYMLKGMALLNEPDGLDDRTTL